MFRLVAVGVLLATTAVGAGPAITFEEVSSRAAEAGTGGRLGVEEQRVSSVVTLADGRMLAARIEVHGSGAVSGVGRLVAWVLGAPGPAMLVDDSVCACCRPALTAFPDGTALLAYRGRSADEVRDIRVTRWRGDRWDPPRPLHEDGWRGEACAGHGPQMVSEGGRVAAAWYTAADHDPRILVSLSPDAGARFLQPLQISESKPGGEVAVALLRDGAMLVVWVDAAGSLWLRRVSPDFVATEPVQLTRAEQGRVKGRLRTTLVRDFAGGREPAQVQVEFAQEGRAGPRALLVTVPEGELIEIEQNCDCASSPEQFRGYPLRGVVAELQLAAATVRINHFEVPGVLAAGTREFRVEPAKVPAAAQPGREFFGRIEQREGAWWLFDLRLIAAPPR
jgi:hypothetical protein